METGLKYRKTFKEGIRKGSDILHDNKLLIEKFLIREKYNIVDEEYNLTVDNDKQMYRDFVRKDRLRMNDKCG